MDYNAFVFLFVVWNDCLQYGKNRSVRYNRTKQRKSDEADVDATTSASALLPGNAAQIAAWIQQKAGGDLFPIIVSEPYSSDYDECLDRAANEKAENARPELVNHVDNMDDDDVIFLGFPNGSKVFRVYRVHSV